MSHQPNSINNTLTDDERRKELRGYAWSYFSLHAEQRLKTFHFFLTLTTVLIGALVALHKNDSAPNASLTYSMICILISLLSFVFWKLDLRNRELIQNAERVLKNIEEVFTPHLNTGANHCNLQLFAHEEKLTANKRNEEIPFPWNRHMSYSECFAMIFLTFGLGGAAMALVFAYSFFSEGASR